MWKYARSDDTQSIDSLQPQLVHRSSLQLAYARIKLLLSWKTFSSHCDVLCKTLLTRGNVFKRNTSMRIKSFFIQLFHSWSSELSLVADIYTISLLAVIPESKWFYSACLWNMRSKTIVWKPVALVTGKHETVRKLKHLISIHTLCCWIIFVQLWAVVS